MGIVNLAPAFPRGALTLCPQLCMGISPRRCTETGLFESVSPALTLSGCSCEKVGGSGGAGGSGRAQQYGQTLWYNDVIEWCRDGCMHDHTMTVLT
jgi:hypothetical protein